MEPDHASRSRSRAGSCVEFHSLKKMKALSQRRQSAPSLAVGKAITRNRSSSRDSFQFPLGPESSPLVRAFLARGPARSFLAHARAQLQTGLQRQERHLFLFTDALLVAKAKSPGHFKVKAEVCLSEMWTSGRTEEVSEGSADAERSFVIGWPTCNCVVTFGSEEVKSDWLSLIRRGISEGKAKDEPKTIPLKIYAKDIGNCAYAKTLVVGNADTTDDVIRTALQQFGITGAVSDHRLWVSCCRDDPPYPLIGHEFPFSIKMNHIRQRDPAMPTDCQAALLLDTRCRFVLTQQKTPGGRKRSLWPIRSRAAATPARLFGRPLTSVCSPERGLPEPVMDMLAFLYQDGCHTRGVFRRSAAVTACRALRERLDGGNEDPQICRQSVFVVASVLKEFLRCIPGGLLGAELYEEWAETTERRDDKERLAATQRLLRLLPNENVLLLRHLLAVLDRIRGNALHNQMTAANLSVCIAPSLLWPPVAEGDAAHKVCDVVRFLIEHSDVVLGDVAGPALSPALCRRSSEPAAASGAEVFLERLRLRSDEEEEEEAPPLFRGSSLGSLADRPRPPPGVFYGQKATTLVLHRPRRRDDQQESYV